MSMYEVEVGMISKVWQHKITGKLYAVALTDNGAMVGALGPLGADDIKYVLLGEWESNAVDHSHVYHNAANFRDITIILENERDRRLLRAAG